MEEVAGAAIIRYHSDLPGVYVCPDDCGPSVVVVPTVKDELATVIEFATAVVGGSSNIGR